MTRQTKHREKSKPEREWTGVVSGNEILPEPEIRKRVSSLLKQFGLSFEEDDFDRVIKETRRFLFNRINIDGRPRHTNQRAALKEGLVWTKKILEAGQGFIEYLDTLDIYSLNRMWEEFGSWEEFDGHCDATVKSYFKFCADVLETNGKIMNALHKIPKDSGPIASTARLIYTCSMAPIFEKVPGGKKATVPYKAKKDGENLLGRDESKCPVNDEPWVWEDCQRHQLQGEFYDCPTCRYKDKPRLSKEAESKEPEGEYYGPFLDFMNALLEAFDPEWAKMEYSVRGSKIRGYLEKRLP